MFKDSGENKLKQEKDDKFRSTYDTTYSKNENINYNPIPNWRDWGKGDLTQQKSFKKYSHYGEFKN
jgi:hypothetical protein